MSRRPIPVVPVTRGSVASRDGVVIVRLVAPLTSTSSWPTRVCSGTLSCPLSMRYVFPAPKATSRPVKSATNPLAEGGPTRISASEPKLAESRVPSSAAYATCPSGVQVGNGAIGMLRSPNCTVAAVRSLTYAAPANEPACTSKKRTWSPLGDHCGIALPPRRRSDRSSDSSLAITRATPRESVTHTRPCIAKVNRPLGAGRAAGDGDARTAVGSGLGYHASGWKTSLSRTTGESGCAVS